MGLRSSAICSEVMTSAGHALEQKVCCTRGDWQQELIAGAGTERWSEAKGGPVLRDAASDDRNLRHARAPLCAARVLSLIHI
eukprot:2985861-Alexandrium_andersonii.AAC.1